MNTAPPPRISIECEGEDVEQLSELHKHYIDGYSSPPSRSSKDSSLEGIASDAFAILLQKALPSLDSSHRTASSTTARARSHTDSVTVFSSSTWHSTPPSQSSHLPPQPKSFSSSCRRSAPIPAFILPCTTPTRNRQQASSSDKLDVFGTLSGLAAPATPLTAASIEELTPGLAQLRRAFPLPPLRKEETTDELQTPTLKSSMAEQQQEDALFFVSHRLPGAFESFDSLDTLHHVDDSGASMTARQDRTSARHPGAALQECPRTPTEQLYHHRRSSSYRSTSSFKPSPGSTSATSSSPSLQKKRSKRTLRNKRSKASFRSMEIVGEDSNTLQEGIYEPSSGYDFRSCPASPSMSQQQQSAQRPTHPPRSASRGSWRSRYPRPDTAMSTVTTAETVYEDAVDHFSGDEADAEEDASEVPAKLSLSSHFTPSTSSANSSMSTIRAYEKPLGRLRLSFQRRRATSSLQQHNTETGRPSSTLSNHSRNSASHAQTKRMSGLIAQQQVLSSSTPRSSPEEGYFNLRTVNEKERDETSPPRSASILLARPSTYHQQRLSRNTLKGHTRDSSSSTSEDRERPNSAMLALRPLMLTPEKTKRGSLKDWSVLLPHGSQFIEEFEHPSIQDHLEIAIPPSLQSSVLYEEDGQTAKENPYAEIYQELAKSPDIESDSIPSSPLLSPSLPETAEGSLPVTATALKTLYTLEPVAEESFVESDKEFRSSRVNSAEAVAESGLSHSMEEAKANDSNVSISVVAITTDSPQPLSAGRQSTESRHKRTSRPPSISTSVDTRIRASSIASSAISRPITATSATTSHTNATFTSIQGAIVESGQKASTQAGRPSRMETRNPRSEGGLDYDLVAFLHGERPDTLASQKAGGEHVLNGTGSPRQSRRSEDATQNGIEPFADQSSSRQRTRSQPAKLHHHQATQPFSYLHKKDEQRNDDDLVNQLLPFDANLRKQVKLANRKVTKKASAPAVATKEEKPNFSTFLLSALKKRKSTTGLVKTEKATISESKVHLLPLPIKDLPISGPSQAKHLCSGAINSHIHRDSPFGRRPSSPVRGYITVPYAGSASSYNDDNISHPLFLDFDIQSTSSTASPVEQISSSQRSSPSQSNTSETYPSPAFFSSPLSSTSSHSEEGPSTPRALSPSTSNSASTSGPIDFWAVSFAEAQAGEGDFIAPHATLVKSSKLAMLSTNEKARRRASKASLRS